VTTYSMPGRAVDIVHAAALACGQTVHSIAVHFSYGSGGAEQIRLNTRGSLDESSGRAVFAALGVTEAVLGERYGSGPQANLDGHIPALDVQLSIIIDDLPPRPAPADPTALIAHVDAVRAADEVDLGPLFAAPQIRTGEHGAHRDDQGRTHRATEVDGEGDLV
jgi:hypothetical protein